MIRVDDDEEEDELQEVTDDSSSVEESSPEQSLISLSLSHSVSSFLITSEVSDGDVKPLKSDL